MTVENSAGETKQCSPDDRNPSVRGNQSQQRTNNSEPTNQDNPSSNSNGANANKRDSPARQPDQQQLQQQQSANSASQGSPTKGNPANHTKASSPSKSRNRKRNDARRRSGGAPGHKRQAPLQPASEPSERPDCGPPSQSVVQDPPPEQHEAHEPQSSQDAEQAPSQTAIGTQHAPTADAADSSTADISASQLAEGESASKEIAGAAAAAAADSLRRKQLSQERQKEFRELKEQVKSQNLKIQMLVDQVRQQMAKVKELEAAHFSMSRTCNQLEKLLQQELSSRSRLEMENENLTQTVARLRSQISSHERSKFNNDEMIRVLNATLMERETEVSILKLKLTRVQTNPSSNVALNCGGSVSSIKQHDPCYQYASTGRSNSEFDRTSYVRSSMRAEAAASIRSSTSQLKAADRDETVWATVPEELTPSRRPELLEKSIQPLYGSGVSRVYGEYSSINEQTSTPITRDRRYRTLPRSMKSPSQEFQELRKQEISKQNEEQPNSLNKQPLHCQVTNLDESNSTSHSGSNRTPNNYSTLNEYSPQQPANEIGLAVQTSANMRLQNESLPQSSSQDSNKNVDSSHYSTISKTNMNSSADIPPQNQHQNTDDGPPSLPVRAPSTPVKVSGLRKIFGKFRRTESTSSNSNSKTDLTSSCETPKSSPFKRCANRSTMVAAPGNIRAQITPVHKAINFQTDKPFAEWNTEMLVDWMTTIGLSMYATQCRQWVKCGAHIMNATPAEVDKFLGITNHLHRKKLRLAISELNGDCDKITKAAAKLDYLWVARWLDDIGLPQYKDSFINARVDGRVLNYLTVEDLTSLGVRNLLHHASIRSGIRVLRLINFDLQLLKRRATAEEIEHMDLVRQQMASGEPTSLTSKLSSQPADMAGEPDLALWTCHRLMEWFRMIDFAEFAPNLRGSGVHGGLIVFEDAFNIDTMCSLLSIPIGRTLLRRHLSTFFKGLVGDDLLQKKRQYQDSPSNQQLNLTAEIKTPKKSPLWFSKLKSSSKVSQDGMDDYLCPMYPVDPPILKSQARKFEPTPTIPEEVDQLARIPESINV